MNKTLVFLLIAFLQCDYINGISVLFTPVELTLHIDDVAIVNYEIYGMDNTTGNRSKLVIASENQNIAALETPEIVLNMQNDSFKMQAIFLGKTVISCRNQQTGIHISSIEITVVRPDRLIDTIFTISVATLVSLVYINFGCAVNWGDFKDLLRKPVGPVIAFTGQFVIMPLVTYGIALLVFSDNLDMQLGLFFVGVSPGGGASNIWTLLLDGNISLSLITSALSTISAFVMMPLWLFTLGKVIFIKGNMAVPYAQISTFVFALIVPLLIGCFIQSYFEKISNFLIKIMKVFSTVLILFIIIFGTLTNLYLFKLFSWKIIIIGMAQPWIGFLVGYSLSTIFKQSTPDRTAISIETGITNTGIAIFLLRFTLPQPEADLTTGQLRKNLLGLKCIVFLNFRNFVPVVPVATSIMTPFPLLILYLYKKATAK